MYGFIGWFTGTILRFLWPYLRAGMEAVAEKGTWSAWPKFELKYLMMFLAAVGTFGLSLLLFQGFIGTVMSWDLPTAALAGYAATAIGRDALGIINSTTDVVIQTAKRK